MDVENSTDGNHFQENSLPYGDRANSGGNSTEILSRVEIELAFASEKLLNLEILVMEIARRATDLEPISSDDDSIPSETAESAFELDMLYGIRDAEVNELDNLITYLQTDIKNFEHKVYEGESGGRVKDRLDAAKLSLKQMQELIADIRNESAKFEKPIEFFNNKEGKCLTFLHLLNVPQLYPSLTAHIQELLKVLDMKVAICHIKLVCTQRINREMFCICWNNP
jgi:hypothetical protein